MNPLLEKRARRVARVELTHRPDLVIYVRGFTGREFLELGEKLNKAEGAKASHAVQLEAFVCDAEGNSLLADGEGLQFIDVLDQADMRRIMAAGEKMNALTDAAVETEIKN